jgi:hypothetical protein
LHQFTVGESTLEQGDCRSATSSGKVQLKDKEGYLIKDDAQFDIAVGPNQEATVTGNAVVDLPNGRNIVSIGAKLF